MDLEALRSDRRRYYAHAATFFIGILGLVFSLAFGAIVQQWLLPWLLVFFSAVLVASGVLAVSVSRTLFSGRATSLGPPDPYEEDGDALFRPGIWTLDFWPSFTSATGPYAVLGVGMAFFFLFLYVALG